MWTVLNENLEKSRYTKHKWWYVWCGDGMSIDSPAANFRPRPPLRIQLWPHPHCSTHTGVSVGTVVSPRHTHQPFPEANHSWYFKGIIQCCSFPPLSLSYSVISWKTLCCLWMKMCNADRWGLEWQKMAVKRNFYKNTLLSQLNGKLLSEPENCLILFLSH